MSTEAGEEFCARPFRPALWTLHVLIVCTYVAGLAFVLATAIVLVLLLPWVPAHDLARHELGGDSMFAFGLLTLGTSGILMIAGARLSGRIIAAGKGLSLIAKDSAIYVTDMSRRRHVISPSDIQQVRVARSFWLGTRIYVLVRSGEQVLLPGRIKRREALIERITGSAGLDLHGREGRWEVYSRSDAGQPGELA